MISANPLMALTMEPRRRNSLVGSPRNQHQSGIESVVTTPKPRGRPPKSAAQGTPVSTKTATPKKTKSKPSKRNNAAGVVEEKEEHQAVKKLHASEVEDSVVDIEGDGDAEAQTKVKGKSKKGTRSVKNKTSETAVSEKVNLFSHLSQTSNHSILLQSPSPSPQAVIKTEQCPDAQRLVFK